MDGLGDRDVRHEDSLICIVRYKDRLRNMNVRHNDNLRHRNRLRYVNVRHMERLKYRNVDTRTYKTQE